jgi:muramoyltetrapeptide carboxypeptidase LdcA involved in peptidoglycan recycling
MVERSVGLDTAAVPLQKNNGSREWSNNYASIARVCANHKTTCLGGNLAVLNGVLRTPVRSDNGSFANTVGN